jgi:hypothetical protein
MQLEASYIAIIQSNLATLRHAFEQELSEALLQPFPENVVCLQMEYDSQVFGDNFGVYLFALDKQAKLVGNIKWFLHKNDSTISTVPEATYYDEQYEEADIDTGYVASQVLENWILDCWAKVGYKVLPAYISHHDSYFKRDLATGETLNFDVIMAKFNLQQG